MNKMRWTSQLSFLPGSLKKTGHARWTEWNELESVDGPCWVKDDAKRAGMTPMSYYRKTIAKENGVKVEEVSDAEIYQHDTVANRIRWHFKVTHAAPASLPTCSRTVVRPHTGVPARILGEFAGDDGRRRRV